VNFRVFRIIGQINWPYKDLHLKIKFIVRVSSYLSVTVAIHGSLTISDFKIKDKKITTLLLPVPASISVVIGSYVSQVQPLAIGFFLLLSYLCVGGRKYGPRFVALGKVSFMCFFGTILFKA